MPSHLLTLQPATPRPRIRRSLPGANPPRAAASSGEHSSARLVSFIGKGGAGKTTAAVLAAKYYASEGLETCFVQHSQDPMAELLLGCKIGNSITEISTNLSAIRFETSKMLIEPLNELKKADARIKLTQGVLEGIVGEELGVLPGMDSILSPLALQKIVNFLSFKRNSSGKEFDVVVYDCISTEEVLRLMGSAERMRWYIKYGRELAEKTDLGRLATPSILKLAYDSARPNGKTTEGRSSAQIWDELELLLEKVSLWYGDPSNFSCFLVMDPSKAISVMAALRYWGCAIQSGSKISGAFGSVPHSCTVHQNVAEKFVPMNFAFLPYISVEPSLNWLEALDSLSHDAKALLGTTSKVPHPSVAFDSVNKAVTLFLPGFEKSEIKLYQYRGGSELLVEAADQRRVIQLPPSIQGKVTGAKLVDSNLVVKLS